MNHEPTQVHHDNNQAMNQGMPGNEPATITHEAIAHRAYDYYVQSGCQQGQCEVNWRQAERDLNHPADALSAGEKSGCQQEPCQDTPATAKVTVMPAAMASTLSSKPSTQNQKSTAFAAGRMSSK